MRTPAVALIVALALAGCASTPQPDDAVAVVSPVAPADFSIDVTILREDEPPAGAPRKGAPVQERASRYVLFPDGTLYHGETPRRPPVPPVNWLPPRVRIVGPADFAGVWALIVEEGMAGPQAGDPPVNLTKIPTPATGVRYVIVVVGDGHRRLFVIGDDPAEDDPAVRLVRRLAALAWVPDDPHLPLATVPLRYDLGADPYARYRQP